MAATAAELAALKQRMDAANAAAQRAEGALRQVMSRLKAEFKCDTLEQAKAKQQELAAATQAAERKFSEALKKFEDKYAAELTS